MARLQRVTSKVFAENATEVGQFGSLNAGAKVTTTDIATIQGLPAWQDGWQAATLGDNCYPTLQERNGLDKVQSYFLNYLYQEGIPEWDSGTTYYKGSIVKLINGTNITLYQSLVDNNTAALSDSNSWEEWNYANSDLSNLSALGQTILDKKVEVEALLQQNGYVKFTWQENNVTKDLIIQWGRQSLSSITPIMADNQIINITVTLPTTFNNIYVAIPIKSTPGCDMAAKGYSSSSFVMEFLNVKNNQVQSSPANAYYIAIGD